MMRMLKNNKRKTNRHFQNEDLFFYKASNYKAL